MAYATTSSSEVRRELPPSTSAAPVSFAGGDTRARLAMARELATDLEGRRRTITLGGSLLLIPASSGVALVASALVGVSGIWLPLCALAGLAVGPALTTAAMAAGNLIGGPAVRRRYWREARELGLSEAQIEDAWHAAERELDERARARLSERRDGMVPLSDGEQSRLG